MRKISKVDTRSHRTAYGKGAILLGIPFVLLGAPLALIGFGAWGVDLDANAPLWVVGAIGVAFALAGAMVIVHGVRGVRNRGKPWPWDETGVRDPAGGRIAQALLGMALFGFFLAPFNWWAFLSDHSSAVVVAVTGFFDLVFVAASGTTVYRALQFLKYGHSRLRFARFPFLVGERLLCVFAPARFPHVAFTLRFVEERLETRGTGEDKTTHLVCYEHYREKQERELSLLETEVDVAFDLPDNPEWATALGGTPLRYWELLVEAEAPGVDFRTTFPLPVYARGTSKTRAPSGGRVSVSESSRSCRPTGSERTVPRLPTPEPP